MTLCPATADSIENGALLPQSVTTRDGFIFDPRTSDWLVRSLQSRGFRYAFSELSLVSDNILFNIKMTMIDILEKQSASHAENLWKSLKHFYQSQLYPKQTSFDFTAKELLAYRASLPPHQAWRLGIVRVLIERAASLGYSIVSTEALTFLNDAVIPGNPKGNDVRTLDPNRGPFTTIELEHLNSVVNTGYVTGMIDLPSFVLCHLLLAFGVRPKQIAAMKECDLIVTKANDGIEVFSLRIPRAKQQGELVRGSFRIRPCDSRLGKLLQQLQVHNSIVKVDLLLSSTDRPLLINTQVGEIPGFDYHYTASELSAKVMKLFENLTSLHVTAKRFRYTLGKRARDDGADIFIIADLLDHNDTQNVKVYTEGGSDIIDRLNKNMVMELAPVAQAFAGLLITRQDIEARKAGVAKRIHDRSLPNGRGADALGNCGMHGFCGLARPVACYTCRNFRPWDDGPHEEVLAALLVDRERQRSNRFSPRIFGLHDRTILAVGRVVQLCQERREVGQGPTA